MDVDGWDKHKLDLSELVVFEMEELKLAKVNDKFPNLSLESPQFTYHLF